MPTTARTAGKRGHHVRTPSTKSPVDASTASKLLAANDVVTPLLECLPSHRPHLRRGRVALEWTYHLDTVKIAHGPAAVDLFLGTPTRHVSARPSALNPPVATGLPL
jgi:hypothetical protein